MGKILSNMVANRMEQVGFSHTRWTTNKERIIALGTRTLSDPIGGCMGELIVPPDHKGGKSVLGV